MFAQGYTDNIQKKQLNRWEAVALGIRREERGTLTLTEKKSMLRKHSYVPYIEWPVVCPSFEDVSVEGQGRPGGRTDRAGLPQGDACCGFGLQWPTKRVVMRDRIQVQPVPKRPPPHFFFFLNHILAVKTWRWLSRNVFQSPIILLRPVSNNYLHLFRDPV